MSEIEDKIREEARKILESGEVSVVIGWGAGSVPFKTTPIFVEKSDDAGKLVWNPACVNNLAVYLPKMAKDKKIGIVAKPCDIRSIVTLIQERQIERDNVYIIGLGCSAVVDSHNLEGHDFRLQDITAVEWENGGLKVTTGTEACTLPRADCLRQACAVCTKRTPDISDVELGEPGPLDEAPPSAIPELPEERQRYWSEQFSKCIRCYACRQVCPACYCETCFADRIEPKWTARKATADEAWMFHATRAMHIAGRCIGCGECERACPVRIPLAQLMREMSEAVKQKYGYEAGDPDEELPVLGQFNEDDVDPAHHSE